ncbi:hypothetical protein MKW92_037775, partial [Papaver armeniacum]
MAGGKDSSGGKSEKKKFVKPEKKCGFLNHCYNYIQADSLKPDEVDNSDVEIPEFNVSYKPQEISPKSLSSVRDFLHKRI